MLDDLDYVCAFSRCGQQPMDSVVYVGEGLGGTRGWRINGACDGHLGAIEWQARADVDVRGEPPETTVMSGALADVLEWIRSDPARDLDFIAVADPQ